LLYARYHIAKVYRQSNMYDLAISLQKELLLAFEQDQSWIHAINCHLELGLNYLEMEQWSKAEREYEEVLRIENEYPNSNQNVAKAIHSIGYIHLKKKYLSDAGEKLSNSLSIFLSIQDNFNLAINYNNLGILALQSNDEEQAISYFQQSVALLNDTNTNTEEIANALKELMVLYEKNENYKQAYIYNQQLNAINEGLIASLEQAKKLHKKYLGEKVNYMLQKQETEKVLQKQKIRMLVLACIFLMAMIISLSFQLKSQKEKRMQENTTDFFRKRYYELLFKKPSKS